MKENEILEFKESLTQEKKAIISIVSILNKHKKGKLLAKKSVVGQSLLLQEDHASGPCELKLVDILRKILASLEAHGVLKGAS